ncbi:hypothetical protein DACRYDRAFT_120013 [Dacryopinax primogenitus]|uniref:Phosphatidate phosphatase APP1 catalytic domain-containing protein n=1 Tax=Dacryopinax primogenitus (strain DJM 731) TaxID=1858805 RepID=M5FNV4_DACPD|nr:uncharacterized protein DACRYDRAFT_120013 [Dacryopinax primogenitus]EJT96583.1 hypothetical protein DACRYDRAFT_120013 [Dacryopinax primogenitus]
MNSSYTSSSQNSEMRTPHFIAAAKAQLRRPAVQARISSAKSLFSATKDYLAQKDYRAAYADVSGRMKSAVSSARDLAGQLARDDDAPENESVQGWVVRKRQTWDEWTRDRRRRRQEELRGTERVWLFPGWAARCTSHSRTTASQKKDAQEPFDVELKVSGYFLSMRPPEQATRAQRAFMRLARSFSSLPRLPTPGSGSGSESASLRSFEGGSTPPSGTASPLMSPLLRAIISEEPEDADLINLDSPAGASKDDGGYFTSNNWVGKDPLPSPSQEPLELDLLTPTPTSAGALVLEHENDKTTPSISLSPVDYSERTAPPPIPLKPASLSSIPSLSLPKPLNPTPVHHAHHVHSPRAPSPLSSPSLGPTRSPRLGPHRQPSPSLGPTRKSTSISSASFADLPSSELRTLHANLEARLQPFWASSLSLRKVKLTISLPPPPPATEKSDSPSTVLANLSSSKAPIKLLEKEVTTNSNGYFDERLRVPWTTLTSALRKAGVDLSRLSNIEVRAEVVPLPPIPSFAPDPTQAPHPTQQSPPLEYALPPSPALRVISDIDDTVKHTGVLLGAKQVFHNVFVRHLDELVLDGVGEWYREMEQWGVGFHYVSNSPYELLPVIREFFEVAGLPQGSIKLKYYSPSAVFTGLWDSAADRKRHGVVEVLDAFPSSRFILIGDTGEQDMELYVQLAQERPWQIVGIFLRDVTPPAWTEDGEQREERRPFRRSMSGMSLASTASLSASLPVGGSPLSSPVLEAYQPRRTHTASSTPPSPAAQPTPQSPAMPSSVAYLSQSAAQQPAPITNAKAGEVWRARLAAARKAVPEGVGFTIFRSPEECGEWRGIVARYAGGE